MITSRPSIPAERYSERMSAAQSLAAEIGLSAVLVGVGAAFDFHAGLKRQAPRWMQHSGLEWLFRLSTEPRRLWRRYLRNNPLFVWHVVLQSLRLKQYPIRTPAVESGAGHKFQSDTPA